MPVGLTSNAQTAWGDALEQWPGFKPDFRFQAELEGLGREFAGGLDEELNFAFGRTAHLLTSVIRDHTRTTTISSEISGQTTPPWSPMKIRTADCPFGDEAMMITIKSCRYDASNARFQPWSSRGRAASATAVENYYFQSSARKCPTSLD